MSVFFFVTLLFLLLPGLSVGSSRRGSCGGPTPVGHKDNSGVGPTGPVPTNILVQFEMIELIEGFLLVFPAHVYSSSLRNSQHPNLTRKRSGISTRSAAESCGI
jgi:hypothetical protein